MGMKDGGWWFAEQITCLGVGEGGRVSSEKREKGKPCFGWSRASSVRVGDKKMGEGA